MFKKIQLLVLLNFAFAAPLYAQVQPVEIDLSFAKTEFIPKEEIIATVVYKNISKDPVRILKLAGWGYPLIFDIVDSRDKHSATIKVVRSKFIVDVERDFIELQPNEVYSQQYVFDEMFGFYETDRYKVTAHYSDVWGLPPLQSNSVNVDILGEKDVSDIAQFVLNIEDLQNFFQPHLPGRKPLVLMKSKFFGKNPELMKFGEPVIYLSEQDINMKGIQNYFVFKDFKIKNGMVDISFDYPLESVSGKVTLSKDDGNNWIIMDKKIVEAKQ